MTKTYERIGGKWVRWSEWSAHANRKAGPAWAQRITDTHEKYGVDGDWLQKQTIDEDICFDTSALAVGDIVKVSGASHKNKQHRYWRVEELGEEEIEVERIPERQVIEKLEEEERSLRSEVQSLVNEAGEESLKRAKEALTQD